MCSTLDDRVGGRGLGGEFDAPSDQVPFLGRHIVLAGQEIVAGRKLQLVDPPPERRRSRRVGDVGRISDSREGFVPEVHIPVQGPRCEDRLNLVEFEQYIDFIADRRLTACGLEPLTEGGTSNPFPWLSEMMDIKKEQNFFEGRVTEYQKASSLGEIDDDDL